MKTSPTSQTPAIDPAQAEAVNRHVLELFRKQIRTQEDTLYGTALFFECVCMLNAGQDAVIETLRKQYRNIIQTGNEVLRRAQTLLDQASADHSKIALVREFTFNPFAGHPDPDEMQTRVRILVDTYNRIFPQRPRSQPFTEAETLTLIDAAGEAFSRVA